MSRNLKIDGQELTGVTKLKVYDTDDEEYVDYIDTSIDSNAATASDIASGKKAYVNGTLVTGSYSGSNYDTETKEISESNGLLDFSSGDVVVNPTSGYLISQVTVKKPSNFIAANIAKDVTIAGITGSYEGSGTVETEVKAITLDFSSGDMTVNPTSGKLISQVTIAKPNALTSSNIRNGYTIEGITGTFTGETAQNDLDGLVDGTIISFTAPSGATKIYKYRFQGMTALKSVDMSSANITSIDDYAFDGCTSIGQNSGTLLIPATVSTVKQYAFRSVGTSGFSFAFSPTDTACAVNTYAFYQSKLGTLSGKLGTIGAYAFQNCSSLTTVNVKITGSISTYAFENCTNVSSHTLDATSVITGLADYAFSRYGSNRSNPEQNIHVFDFRNSTFTNVPQYTFGYASSTASTKSKYQEIYFPSTLTSVAGNAFANSDHCDYYFSNTTPPTLSSISAFSTSTNYRIFAPYNNVNAYRTATNWATSSIATNIKGYGTFAANDTLPLYNTEGYGLTWYSDKAMSTSASGTVSTAGVYYCAVGTEKQVFEILSISATDCTLVITDSNSNTYTTGDSVIQNTSLTITATPDTAGDIPYLFSVNGTDVISSVSNNSYTFTVTGDVSVTVVYYTEGVQTPANPTFSENDWITINAVVRSGNIPPSWQVGNTKSVTLTNNATMTVRIADLTASRYALSDNSGNSNMVLEFVDCFATTYQMNSSNTNSGGWASSYMKNTVMPTLYNLLPPDLQGAISEVKVLSGTGGVTTSGTSSSDNKLFLPCEWEIFGAQTYSIGETETANGGVNKGRFGYYSTNNTADDRIKKVSGSASAWWLRSPFSGNEILFCPVTVTGGIGSSAASNARGVAPCFAI